MAKKFACFWIINNWIVSQGIVRLITKIEKKKKKNKRIKRDENNRTSLVLRQRTHNNIWEIQDKNERVNPFLQRLTLAFSNTTVSRGICSDWIVATTTTLVRISLRSRELFD